MPERPISSDATVPTASGPRSDDAVAAPSGDGWRYAIGLGANIAPRQATLAAAIADLLADGALTLLARSRWWQNPAVGGPPGQPPFLNGALVVRSTLGPHQVLHRLQAIESRHGRVRSVAWGARTIDLDLLLRDDAAIVASPVLTLPHPRLASRPFVLVPLAEVAGGWRVPGYPDTVARLADRVRPHWPGRVHLADEAFPPGQPR